MCIANARMVFLSDFINVYINLINKFINFLDIYINIINFNIDDVNPHKEKLI
jgi:hypothetical protein